MGGKWFALATASLLPELDEDGPPLIDALAARGVAAEPALWDDLQVDWNQFDLVAIRTT